uniref:Uncharacterized protein n=1 Tax=Physcomitrium patens TaxID=3218 RepID=A0A7I4BR48_PHYPA
MPAATQEATTRDWSTGRHEGLPRVGASKSYDRASRYEDLSYDKPFGRDGDTIVCGVVSKVALTDASRVGTNVACASLAEVEDGADIDSINDDPDVRRAGGATSREQAKT